MKNYGKPDVNGLVRAPKETILQYIQIIVDSFLFGWTIYHLLMMDDSEVHRDAYYVYWMIIDCTIMFFIQPYSIIGSIMQR